MTTRDRAVIRLSRAAFDGIMNHLLPNRLEQEEVAFGFAEFSADGGEDTFDLIEWTPVPPEGFRSRSQYHLDLSDETRIAAIMRAHELGCSLIEWHSHCGPWPARFSPSDQMGFAEFVPHVRWRLNNRPYAAVVVASGSFDALGWIGDASPQRLSLILRDEGLRLEPTGLSSLRGERSYG